jgi:hypothetical protein
MGYYSNDDIQQVNTTNYDETYPRQRAPLIGTTYISTNSTNPTKKITTTDTTLDKYAAHTTGVLVVLCCRNLDTETIFIDITRLNNKLVPNIPSRKIRLIYQNNILNKYLNKTIDNIKTANYYDCNAHIEATDSKFKSLFGYNHYIKMRNRTVTQRNINKEPDLVQKIKNAKNIKIALNATTVINRSQKALNIFDLSIYLRSLFSNYKNVQTLKRKIHNILKQDISSGKQYEIFNSIFKLNLYSQKQLFSIDDFNMFVDNLCLFMNFNVAMSYILYVCNTLQLVPLFKYVEQIINSNDKYIYTLALFHGCKLNDLFINAKMGEHITMLDVDDNNLTNIMCICSCLNLESIFASNNNILFIPDCISNLTSLIEINLENNPKLLFANSATPAY